VPHANYRLAAREHLAEAAALHAEGALGAAVCRLRAAATAAVAAVVEAAGSSPDRRLLPPVAADLLGRRGVAVGGVRDLVHDLHLDCHAQGRGRATEFTSARVMEAIAAVQALVDLTWTARPATATVGPRRTIELFAADAAPAPVATGVPYRPEAWLVAARRRARRRRIRTALLSLVMAVLLAGGATAAVIAGERNGPRSALDVMARAHGLSDLPEHSR
jgi:hypothetical protein